ncbi:MAG: integrase [Novosphingobium lindaniclasticum]|jgi:integrase|uniref:tyrosine-type recombinase/integrase n=1 Tax=Novosphingobium lindaniclasticum TaxID=1329895 RepID=UPI0024092FD5|nr:integrase arm-type DNA-binding domain-containing protein [Novosphingobium lindaniclasticum]MDF2640231.1 integrase [Novosphingobium lindaniclasticum]
MTTLYAATVANAKPRDRDYKLSDGGGLYLLVRSGGAKLWRFNYRFFDKHRTLAFGAWPDVSLVDARARRDEARRLLAAGVDPSHQQKVDAAKARLEENDTFKTVALEWLAKNEREGLAEITLSKMKWLLDKAYPRIGTRPVAKITAQEVLAVLRAVEEAGHYESARRLRSVLSRVFRYAIATTRAERDPASDLRGALTVPKSKHLAAITTPNRAGDLMRAIERFSGHVVTLYALRLSAHLFVRPGELRKAEWTEFDFERGVWNVPAEKMKKRRPHRVPLSSQVVGLFEELWEHTGHGGYCFPSVRTGKRPMSENTVIGALRALGFPQDEMSAHGFRAMAATLLNESGRFNPDAIERQLAHMENNGVRRAYTRGEYWSERVSLMQYWSDELERLREGAQILKPRFGARRSDAP